MDFQKQKNEEINVTSNYDSHWVSDNIESVTVYKGEINAKERGKANIKVRYFGKLKKIKLEVQ